MSDPVPMCPGCKRIWQEMVDARTENNLLTRLIRDVRRVSRTAEDEMHNLLEENIKISADRDRLLEQSAQREADYALGLQVANKARELAEDGEKIVRHDLAKMQKELAEEKERNRTWEHNLLTAFRRYIGETDG